ncbi:aminotransferase class V-fold PLP-dependent enzyme [Microbacterium paulum]
MSEPDDGAGRPGFDYLSGDAVYLDSACQTLRPQPVIDAVQDYYLHTGACGGRVKYDAGRRVDAQVQVTRERALAAFGVVGGTRAPSRSTRRTASACCCRACRRAGSRGS